MLGCKPANSPVDSSLDLWDTSSNILEDVGRYRRFVGKLIYLTVTRPDITFAVGLVSQFMHQRREIHWQATLQILSYLKSTPGIEVFATVIMVISMLLVIQIPDIREIGETENLLLDTLRL